MRFFFTIPTATFRVLFVFIMPAQERRRIVHFNATEHQGYDMDGVSRFWGRFLKGYGAALSASGRATGIYGKHFEQSLCAAQAVAHEKTA